MYPFKNPVFVSHLPCYKQGFLPLTKSQLSSIQLLETSAGSTVLRVGVRGWDIAHRHGCDGDLVLEGFQTPAARSWQQALDKRSLAIYEGPCPTSLHLQSPVFPRWIPTRSTSFRTHS